MTAGKFDQHLRIKCIGKFDLQQATATTAETSENGPVTSERESGAHPSQRMGIHSHYRQICINTSSTVNEVLIFSKVFTTR